MELNRLCERIILFQHVPRDDDDDYDDRGGLLCQFENVEPFIRHAILTLKLPPPSSQIPSDSFFEEWRLLLRLKHGHKRLAVPY